MSNRVVYVSCDMGMVFGSIKTLVVEVLQIVLKSAQSTNTGVYCLFSGNIFYNIYIMYNAEIGSEWLW